MFENRVAVVILNFNGKHFLEKFLPAVLRFSDAHKIIVADNNSTDDSVAFVRTVFPEVGIIQNPSNSGFAQGYNDALKQVRAEYYVLLNSDVEVTENWIGNVLRLMEKDPKIAACQPKILDFNKRDSFEYAGASGGFVDKYGYPFCRGRIFNSVEEDQGQYNFATEVFWATGACMFVRSKAFWEVGGFDSDYFAHMEEIDLCWRLKNTGYSIYAEPSSIVYHVGGGTLNKVSPRKTYLNFRNNLTTLTKNHPPKYLLWKILYRLVLDGIAANKFLIDGQPSHCIAVLKAHYTYYTWLPAILRKRKEMTAVPGFRYTFTKVYSGNIVREYFLRGKRKFTDLDNSDFLS